MRLPPRVVAHLDMSMTDYWADRLTQTMTDTYRDRRIAKLPEDLRVYQHIIWETQPEFFIETRLR